MANNNRKCWSTTVKKEMQINKEILLELIKLSNKLKRLIFPGLTRMRGKKDILFSTGGSEIW